MGFALDGIKIDLVVAGGSIVAPTIADAGVDKAVRLILLHKVVQLVGLLGGNGTRHVEPDEAEIAVFGEDLLDLRLDLRFKALRIVLFAVVRKVPVVRPVRLAAAPCLADRVAAAVRFAPVQILRIVETELQPMLVACFGKLGGHVAPKRCSVHDVVF